MPIQTYQRKFQRLLAIVVYTVYCMCFLIANDSPKLVTREADRHTDRQIDRQIKEDGHRKKHPDITIQTHRQMKTNTRAQKERHMN